MPLAVYKPAAKGLGDKLPPARALSASSLKSVSSTDSLSRTDSFQAGGGGEDVYSQPDYFPPSVYDASSEEGGEALSRFLGSDKNEKEATIARMLDTLSSEVNTMIALASIADLTAIATNCGLTSHTGVKIVITMVDYIKSTQPIREAGLLLLKCLLVRVGRRMEPFMMPLLSKILALVADRLQAVRDLAVSIYTDMTSLLNPYAFRSILPTLLQAMTDDDWRIKVAALQFLRLISPRASRQVSPMLSEIIPAVSECIINTKTQVQQAGLEALTEACKAITNDDIRHLVPQLVSVIARPDESEKTLNLLLETTFVATVDSPTLALIAPTLGKALRSRSSPLKRKAARVIDNMCRLVTDPTDVAPFVPMLLPALNKVIDEIVDAEVRDVSIAARAILLKAVGEGQVTPTTSSSNIAAEGDKDTEKVSHVFTRAYTLNLQLSEVRPLVLAALTKTIGEPVVDGPPRDTSMITNYIASMVSSLLVYDSATTLEDLKNVNIDPVGQDPWRVAVAISNLNQWRDCIVPYAAELQSSLPIDEPLVGPSARTFCDSFSSALRVTTLNGLPDAAAARDAEDGNVCDFEFSLAFGGKILLHQTRLRLGRGRRYGIMGKNGSGKTTLLTNIGSGNIEGLPAHLKTVYVQHDDASDDGGVPLLDEMMAGKDMIEANVTREEASSALKEIFFTDEMLSNPRNSLSGGWKMKLLIVRAMLSRANVLLLDEPTNHLDTASVDWLTRYLNAQEDITCMIVSHDIPFLDNVISDVIHYENKKLVYYHGNMTHFVEIHPEAKYYYELQGSTLEFKFPIPERLEGINSLTRSVMTMKNCTYTYPGASKPQLKNVSVKLSLGSRVGIVGANGAGKSTLIKLLVQESEPDPGCGAEIWKHHNLRVAYVAQHSFHHVEQHINESPVDYMKWRFAGGVDRESLEKTTTKLTDEEIFERKGEKKMGDVDQIVGRRKNGRTMEYECTFFGQNKTVNYDKYGRPLPTDQNKYIAIEELEKMGLMKLVQQCDTRIAAAAAGLDLRPLLTAEIQAHLDDFCLETEYGTHSTIRRLSGGQKVKLVLAAAMWNKPHVIVLDEPTNYLDREALGALTKAIQTFAGGVVIISHNAEFTDALCKQKWIVANGECTMVGEVEDEENGGKVKAESERKVKKSRSATNMADKPKDDAGGNTNKSILTEVILNPKTLEVLSKKEARLLSRQAEIAGMLLKDYVLTIKSGSPEWKWL